MTWHHSHNVIQKYQKLASDFIANTDPYPTQLFNGRGIVICGGGARLFTNAWVCINMLRHFKCSLPIQLWYLDECEMDPATIAVVKELDVECVNAQQIAKTYPMKNLNGWELKAFALLYSRFNEVLLLDADNIPTADPSYLFDTQEYKTNGAIFWPDYGRLGVERPIWQICEVPYRDEPEIESGQVIADKQRCWKALSLARHYNEHSDFYYRYIHGDKCTFQLAFHRLDTPYSIPPYPIYSLDSTMCQRDFKGYRIFQHRNMDKWNYSGANKHIFDFWHEPLCRDFIKQLRENWCGRIWWSAEPDKPSYELVKDCRFKYTRVGHDNRDMTLNSDRTVGEGAAACERAWNTATIAGQPFLILLGDNEPTCKLTHVNTET